MADLVWVQEHPGPWHIEVTFEGIDLAAVAAYTGIPLVDLSIEYEPWLIRGDQ